MLTVEYDDVKRGEELQLKCCDGIPEEILINGVPETEEVLEGSYQTSSGEESISCQITRTGKSVTIKPTFKADSLAQCMLIKDSLLLLPLNRKDFLLRLKTVCSCKNKGYDRFMLVLDLGNTRTCGLTCSTLWDPADQNQWSLHPMSFEPLKMRINYDGAPVGTYCSTVFSSKCVLGVNTHEDWTRSFLQLANNAEMYLRNMPSLNGLNGHVSAWRWTLSGPKRYFWQNNVLRYNNNGNLQGATSQFHYLVPGKDVNDPYAIKMLDLGLAKAMGYNHLFKDPQTRKLAEEEGFYPYSLFLKGMIWELMEQAELQVKKNTDARYPFRLTDLVVTFPAVWTEEERQEYEKQIRETIDLYVQQRCGHCADQIELDISCDEGMAVLVTYLYSEIQRKHNLDNKIAVIDIGGGTSDLVVCEIAKRTNDTYGTKYSVTPIFSSGTNEAGDAFIRTLVTEFVVPTVFNWMFNDLLPEEYTKILEKLKDVIFSNDVSQLINQESLEKLVFELWYPAALQLLEKAKQNKPLSRNEEFKVSFESSMGEGLDELWRILKERSGELGSLLQQKHNQAALHAGMDGGEFQMTLYNADLQLIDSEKFLEHMKEAVKKTFADTLASFSRIIIDNHCKTVLFSGKISEIKLVQDIFRECLKEKGQGKINLISMNDYNYKNLPIEEAISQDSKYATVTGAGLYHMIKTGRMMGCDIEILPQKKEDPFIWGIWRGNDGYERIRTFLNAAITNFKLPIYVARKCAEDDSVPWLPSYELRVNPMRKVEIDKDNPVRFRFSAGDPHPVLVGKGRFSLDDIWYDTKDLEDPEMNQAYKQAFEFRIYKMHNAIAAGDLSWLDSGMVFDIN